MHSHYVVATVVLHLKAIANATAVPGFNQTCCPVPQPTQTSVIGLVSGMLATEPSLAPAFQILRAWTRVLTGLNEGPQL